ncbi:putative L-asparaginase [Gordonia namibiensis NBRC 108229]|uniref:asparaginase n=1 Tax=Gordonia namibiensis NBRC 108229 TaxID=1208314 RepID=K6WRF8_9ACTN|nr:asparaginase [Gordonia namibiensis]GAC02006.1 putative L-asparaginase [Gordonia namibiensis NBRC 108229]
MSASPPPGSPTTVLITTGGTIAAQTTTDGAVPALGADDLLSAASNTGAVDAGAGAGNTGTHAVRTVDLMSVDSSAMTVADQFAVVRAIADALDDTEVAGVVVTHGTDTMEETAFLADLYCTDERPVVFTGAQLPADRPDADGPINLAAALAAVRDPGNRGHGVLVVAGGRVLPARGLFKVSTSDAVAFDSVRTDLPRPVLTDGIPLGRTARVDLFALYPGVSPGLIAAAVAQNAAGIVLAATGSGNTHPDITAEVALAVAHGVTVVVTSRVPYGEVSATYGGGGGAVDLHRAGAIVSPWLRAPQARMALIALLTARASRETVTEFFSESGK